MSDTSDRISALVDAAGPGHVWVPSDFAHLGARDLVDKTLQRMVARGELRRIERAWSLLQARPQPPGQGAERA
ncbi:MAG: hypothetical protein QM805_22400 [Pseudomonas sp.]